MFEQFSNKKAQVEASQRGKDIASYLNTQEEARQLREDIASYSNKDSMRNECRRG
jgi:hypothetical protein